MHIPRFPHVLCYQRTQINLKVVYWVLLGVFLTNKCAFANVFCFLSIFFHKKGTVKAITVWEVWFSTCGWTLTHLHRIAKDIFSANPYRSVRKKKKKRFVTHMEQHSHHNRLQSSEHFFSPPPPPVKTCIIILRIYLSFFACKSKTFGLKSDLFVCSPTQLHLGWWMRKEFLLVGLTWLFEPPWVTS